MNRLSINKPKATAFLCCLFVSLLPVVGQESAKQTYTVDSDVTLVLNASHVNLQFETWNKNKVEIETVTSRQSQPLEGQQQGQVAPWKPDVRLHNNVLRIDARGTNSAHGFVQGPDLNLDFSLIGPMVDEMVSPLLENIPQMPPLPERISVFSFDYDAYRQDPENYMKAFESRWSEDFSEAYAEKMEAWAKQFEEKMQQRSQVMEQRREAIEARNQEWAERYAERMKQWGEEMGGQMQSWSKHYTDSITGATSRYEGFVYTSKATPQTERTLIIRMPKNAKLQLNVSHGEVKLAGQTTNLRANMRHSKLDAQRIDGKATAVQVAYAPVFVKEWKEGGLTLKYVEQCVIESVEDLNLTARTSDVSINSLNGNALIDGSMGRVRILQIDPGFSTLNISLNNSRAVIKLPKNDYSLYVNGDRTEFDYPKGLSLQDSRREGHTIIKSPTQTSDRSIQLNARFSNVVLE